MSTRKKIGEFVLNLSRPEGHLAAYKMMMMMVMKNKLPPSFWDLRARFWDLGLSNRDRNGNSWNFVLLSQHCTLSQDEGPVCRVMVPQCFLVQPSVEHTQRAFRAGLRETKQYRLVCDLQCRGLVASTLLTLNYGPC
jgi:hypothetical protein